MKVKVIADKFGTYTKGDEIDMHESTAKAVAKNGHVELIAGSESKPEKGKKK